MEKKRKTVRLDVKDVPLPLHLLLLEDPLNGWRQVLILTPYIRIVLCALIRMQSTYIVCLCFIRIDKITSYVRCSDLDFKVNMCEVDDRKLLLS